MARSARERRSGARGSRSRVFEREAFEILGEAGRTMRQLAEGGAAAVAAAARLAVECLRSGGTVFFCGNGGSAADAQHLAAELSGRYLLDRAPLSAMSLTTNSSALTAIGNDYGFDEVFSRQLEGAAKPGDLLVAISTSGTSPNILAAVRSARHVGMRVVGMTGQKGSEFARSCDVALVTPSGSTPRVQEGHIAMGHALCELIERAMFGDAVASAPRTRRGRTASAPRSAAGAARSGSGRKGRTRGKRS